MAPRGKKKTDAAATGNLSHDTSNTLSDDDVLALTLQHKRQIATIIATEKKVVADRRNAWKKAKAELGSAGVADIKDMLAEESDEKFTEKLRAELERKSRLTRWLGLELGTQSSLFDSGTAPSLAEKAYADGKRAGLSGEILQPPHHAGSESYNEYVRGWHDGQAVLAAQIKRKEATSAPITRPDENQNAAPDDLDNAAGGATFDVGDPEGAVDAGEEVWPDDAEVAGRGAEDE